MIKQSLMPKKRSFSDKILLIIKGFAMGTVNKIPGISGGIVALVSGFYLELIYSLKKINLISLKLILSGKWRAFYRYTNAEFLIFLFCGSIISFFSMSLILDFLILNYPNYLWSSFFGMVLASIYFVKPLVTKWNLTTFILFITGASVGILISLSDPGEGSENLFFIYFCGIISVSGMTLPGLSGSFLLLLLGNYELLLVDSVNAFFYSIVDIIRGNFNLLENKERLGLIKILLVFVLGSITGLVFFVNLLSYVLKKFYSYTISLILGFISGSIICLWPWRKLSNNQEINYYIPSEFNKETILMLICIKLGLTFVYLLEKYGKKK